MCEEYRKYIKRKKKAKINWESRAPVHCLWASYNRFGRSFFFPGWPEMKGRLSYSKMIQEVCVSTKDTQNPWGTKVNKTQPGGKNMIQTES